LETGATESWARRIVESRTLKRSRASLCDRFAGEFADFNPRGLALRSATAAAHLRLVSSNDPSTIPDALKRISADYLARLVELVAQFLAPDKITNYRIEGVASVAKSERSLHIAVSQHGRDLVENTKIFAAVNAAKTYLSFKMDNLEIAPDLHWGDVIVTVNFTEPGPPVERTNPRERLRLVIAPQD